MGDMPPIEKGNVSFGNTNYKAYSIDSITSVLRGLMADNGLAIVPEISEIFEVGGNIFIRFTFRLIDSDSNEAILSNWVQPLAKGKDISKDMGAAISYATKNFLMRTFMISPEGDTDLDHQPQQPNPRAELWDKLRNDSQVMSHYDHEAHLKNTLPLYEGDVLEDGFSTVKAWLLNRKSDTKELL